ncbi:S8 family peptidase [Providencia rettgeri]
MTQRKKHLKVIRFVTDENFKSKKIGRSVVVIGQDRRRHGNLLTEQYNTLIHYYEQNREETKALITPDIGIYVQIISVEGSPLPLESLDNRDFKLYNCQVINNREVALVFIPEQRRSVFLKKIEQYLDPSKDSPLNRYGHSYPRNHTLIDSIAEIKLADLSSFWTDPPELFPENKNDNIWWELWLKKVPNINNIATDLAKQVNGRLGNTSISFFDSVIILIKSSAAALEKAPELISNLKEIRKAKETPVPILSSSPVEQFAWLQSIAERVRFTDNVNTCVSILDTGVNYNNYLLRTVCSGEYATAWDAIWPHYDEYSHSGSYEHGSLQAGLAAFGNLMDCGLDNEPVTLSHFIESGRILPPYGNNDPALYGAITVGTASKLEIDRPDINRVYSLAITSDGSLESGKPSSWSAEIDQFCSGVEDGKQRLFVISAGNNVNIFPDTDYWEQVHLAQIEDPAQSWNALTIGAYTEMTTNDDPDFVGWSPFACSGDIAPTSRSSVNWSWRKQSPFKPDVVAEGGNRLISPDRTEISNEDVVSLLTTSGRTTGQLFERSGDTSAACALVSKYAAQLMAEYPDYWPETIRGLIIHSASWTPRMMERFGGLCRNHSLKIAKEALLRTVGYGVPDIERARYSANNALTLIAEGEIQPFIKRFNATNASDPTINQMKLYQLPWPLTELQNLPPELEVKLKVTLSYFIEPNPGRRGYRSRFSYQSHGLRFETIRPGQTVNNFRASINALAGTDEYRGPEGDNNGWFLGTQLRTRGSVHSDTWVGSAQDLADMHTIAVFPVGGWWKYKIADERWKNHVRFSLLVSIEVPETDIDIYSVIENKIQTEIENITPIEVIL